jgi:hypothetical protein
MEMAKEASNKFFKALQEGAKRSDMDEEVNLMRKTRQ